MNYLDTVRELKEHWGDTTGGEARGAKSVLSSKSPSQPDTFSDHLLSRLQADSVWLTAQHQAWLDDKKDAASDERFSVALAAWAEMEQSLRAVYGYEGCIQGPDQQCPQDVLVTCDLCVG